MTAVDSFLAEVQRDHLGRYLLPDPATGEIRPWTRTTTVAETISDRRALERWTQRGLARGLAGRPDLVAQAATADPEDRQLLGSVVDAALDAAKLDSKAKLGTTLHSLTEAIDRGDITLNQVPDEHRPDITAYVECCRSHQVEILPWGIEVVVINTVLDVAGTADRIVTVPWRPLPVIFDVKSGHGTVKYGGIEVGAQLATYANASHWWNGTLHEMPPLDREVGLVAHMPAGAGTCDLYEVDLVTGLTIARLCVDVRDHRALNPLRLRPIPDGLLQRRVEWLRGWIRSLPPPARVEAGKTWPAGTPRKADELTTHAQVDAIAACLCLVGQAHQLSFPAADPRDDHQPAPAVVEHPASRPDPRAEATEWGDRGRALFARFGDDEPLARACAQAARCADTRMTELAYERLEAVVTQIGDPNGAIAIQYRSDGPAVIATPDAGHHLADLHGGKGAALAAAKALAKAHGLAAPRSLDQVVEDPLLVALVAGSTNTNIIKENNT